MTHREHLKAALLGEPVDCPPIWLREGFDFLNGPANGDNFTLGWQDDPVYRELYDFAKEHCVMNIGWSPGGHFNRYLCIPPSRIRGERRTEADGSQVATHYVDTPQGTLTAVSKHNPGLNTSWKIEPLPRDRGDLEKILSIPFEVEPVRLDSYHQALERAGDRALPWTGVSCPFVVISGCMELKDLLLLTVTEREFIHELLEEITRRVLLILDEVYKDGPLDTFANIGGSEQVTPPMTAPEAYDEFVVPYDGRIVAKLKECTLGVNCHCHGKVRHALKGMVAMGFDSTDPVEPPPAGDLTIAEAREIVGDKLTFIGNLEFDELETAGPEHIRSRVREILEVGPQRLVLGASAGPISRVTERLAANYRAWIETALEARN
ncbi:hypothetical protein H8D79_01655 [PVC group bacterium]|nr:hypothetical protein [PVC group bacterium]